MSSITPRVAVTRNNKKILIRTAFIRDAKQICDLMYNISKERVYTVHEPEEFTETTSSYRRKIKKYNNSPGKLYLVAEFRKKIIGQIQFDNFDYQKSAHAGFLSIYIKKSWRNLGLGKILIKEILEWGKNSELIEKIVLNVFSTNTRAISLYQKMGFKQEGFCLNDMKINGEYAASILMYKFV